jgi:hypothetical protein
MLRIHPDDCISFRHNHFPEDIFCILIRLEKTIFWYISYLGGFFPIVKLTHIHPHIIDMPAPENPSKILSEKHALKSPFFINNINP